jgi:hypothetical protein
MDHRVQVIKWKTPAKTFRLGNQDGIASIRAICRVQTWNIYSSKRSLLPEKYRLGFVRFTNNEIGDTLEQRGIRVLHC